ncbi:Pickpocket protein 28 [Folsomia candida]|uniref:Pickpocket protein 28 n=1 Tax=Folsomia candida TaxID=158441 RepID=A0A226DRT6_FOLCA|nr:Pickpocket protein 28 [Folsomia candida]
MTICCTILGIILIIWATSDTIQTPVAIRIDPQEIDTGNIIFPGTTILAPGSLKYSFFPKMRKLFEKFYDEEASEAQSEKPWTFPNLAELLFDASQICEWTQSHLKQNGVVQEIGEGEMLSTCSLGGRNFTCGNMFLASFTELGGAFTFNGIPELTIRQNASLSTLLTGDPPNHVVEEWMKFDFDVNAVSPKTTNSTRVFPPIPFKQKVPGKPSGLKFLVKFDEAEFACRQKDGTGFTLSVHNPIDAADIRRFGLELPFGMELSVAIIPTVIQADEDIKFLDPVKLSLLN